MGIPHLQLPVSSLMIWAVFPVMYSHHNCCTSRGSEHQGRLSLNINVHNYEPQQTAFLHGSCLRYFTMMTAIWLILGEREVCMYLVYKIWEVTFGTIPWKTLVCLLWQQKENRRETDIWGRKSITLKYQKFGWLERRTFCLDASNGGVCVCTHMYMHMHVYVYVWGWVCW